MNEIAFIGTVLSLVFMAATVLMAIYLWRIAAERVEEANRLKKIAEGLETVAANWREKFAFKCEELDKYKRDRKEYESGFIQSNQEFKKANDRLRDERRALKDQIATKTALIDHLRGQIEEVKAPVENEAKLLRRIEMQRSGLVRYWRIARALQAAYDRMKYRTTCFEAVSLEAAKRGRRIEAQSKALKKFRDRLVDALTRAEALAILLEDRQVAYDKLRRELEEATDVCAATDEANDQLRCELIESKEKIGRLEAALESLTRQAATMRKHAEAIIDPGLSAEEWRDKITERIDAGERIRSSELRAAGEAVRSSAEPRASEANDMQAESGNMPEGFGPSKLQEYWSEIRRRERASASDSSAMHAGDLESQIIERCGEKLREQAEAEAAKEEAEILYGRPGGAVPSGVFDAKGFREEVFSSFVGKRIAFRGREEGTFLEVSGVGNCKLFTEDNDSGEPMLCVGLDDGSEVYFYPSGAEVVADPNPEDLGIIAGPIPFVGLKIDLEFVGATEFASVKTGPDSVKEIDFVKGDWIKGGAAVTAEGLEEQIGAFDHEAFEKAKREAAGLQKIESDGDCSGFVVQSNFDLKEFPIRPMPADPEAVRPDSWTAATDATVRGCHSNEPGSMASATAKIIDQINADPKLREGDGEAKEAGTAVPSEAAGLDGRRDGPALEGADGIRGSDGPSADE